MNIDINALKSEKRSNCLHPDLWALKRAKAALIIKGFGDETIWGADLSVSEDEIYAATDGLALAKDSKPYGDVPYADDKGFQPDGKKRYPIDTEQHVKSAWNYIHQKKNEAKYTASQLAHIKQRIISAWKRLIDKDGPPSAK